MQASTSAEAELLAFSPERRLIDALQFTEEFGEVCPANWNKGDKTIKPTDEWLKEYIAE
jgi:alkyl hydroperoxide reductase subunit AhpC